MLESVTGVVLVGGRPHHLSFDRAFLAQPDGRCLLRAIVEKLAAVCPEVVVTTSAPERYRGLDLPARLVCDHLPGQGPLGGIHAALHTVSTKHALIVACDMPFLNADLLRYMLNVGRHYEALVPVQGRHWHTLHAIYARSCLPAIEHLLAQGCQEVRELLPRVRLEPLTREKWEPLDPQGLSFFNLNRPEDLLVAQRIWRGGKPDREATSA